MSITPVTKKYSPKDRQLNITLKDYAARINEIIKKYKVIVQDKEPRSPDAGTVWVDTSNE